MPRAKKPENNEPQIDRNIYDVAIDNDIIDYIAKKNDIPIWCDDERTIKSHAVSLRLAGWTDAEICNGMCIGRAKLAIWQDDDDLYKACMQFVKVLEADDVEQLVWQMAKDGKSNDLVKFFALKARKQEYKDNAPQQTEGVRNIVISIGEKVFDVTENYKSLPSGQ